MVYLGSLTSDFLLPILVSFNDVDSQTIRSQVGQLAGRTNSQEEKESHHVCPHC